MLDTGARGATNSFAQRGLGDVLLAWENEAWLARKEFGADDFEIVYPSLSILAEPPVAVVDSVVDKKGTRAVAQAYLEFLYTQAGPGDRRAQLLPPARSSGGGAIRRTLSGADAGSPSRISAAGTPRRRQYFADGGMFDRIFTPGQ